MERFILKIKTSDPNLPPQYPLILSLSGRSGLMGEISKLVFALSLIYPIS